MKDGLKIPTGTNRPYYYQLVDDYGWWCFKVPGRVFKEVKTWLDAAAYDDSNLMFISSIGICLRRREDAVLFRLSFPEATPLMSSYATLKMSTYGV